jgi:peptidyl-prolyl cis-trans isomerase C
MTQPILAVILTVLWLAVPAARAADNNAAAAAPAAKPATSATDLFPDEVLCRGTGVEVKRSQVDRAFLQYRANAAARGQSVPEAKRAELEALLLDRIVVTALLTNRATVDDQAKAKAASERLSGDVRRQAGSDEAFKRQLTAMGFTVEDLESQILERATCEEVVDRELKSKVVVTDEQVKRFFAENAEQMTRPETVRASHILISTRNQVSNEEFDDAKKKEKRQLAEKVLERARKGEDFAALVKQYSDDPGSRDKGGEYTFTRGQMVPEFEKAAFALQTNQISDVVTTKFGYHVIKVYEHAPAEKLELAKVEKDIRDVLARDQVQEKLLPEFLLKLKDEAKLKYLNGAQPPTAFAGAATNSPPAQPGDK